MPNWAFGTVKVTGTREGVKSFVERFISSDDQSTVPGKRFLPGAFPSRSESRASSMPWKNSKGKQITKLLSIPSSSCLLGLFGPA